MYVNGDGSEWRSRLLEPKFRGGAFSCREAGVEVRKNNNKSEHDVDYGRASWGAAVLRPYTEFEEFDGAELRGGFDSDGAV